MINVFIRYLLVFKDQFAGGYVPVFLDSYMQGGKMSRPCVFTSAPLSWPFFDKRHERDPDFNRAMIVSLLKDFSIASEFPAPIDIYILEGPDIQYFLFKLSNGAKSDSIRLYLGPRQKFLYEAMRVIEFVPWLGVLHSSTMN
jgi:hypothetical protein